MFKFYLISGGLKVLVLEVLRNLFFNHCYTCRYSLYLKFKYNNVNLSLNLCDIHLLPKFARQVGQVLILLPEVAGLMVQGRYLLHFPHPDQN